MIDSKDVWLAVYVAALERWGEDNAAGVAERACGKFEKKFSSSAPLSSSAPQISTTPLVIKQEEVKK